MSIIRLCKNGDIKYFGVKIGEWEKIDVWKENNGRYNLSGCRLVHYFYNAYFIDGTNVTMVYKRGEITDFITNGTKLKRLIDLDRMIPERSKNELLKLAKNK